MKIEKIVESKRKIIEMSEKYNHHFLNTLPIFSSFNYKAYRDYYKNDGTEIYVEELENKTLAMTERWLRMYGGKKNESK